MPQPYKGFPADLSPRALFEVPECTMFIGTISALWSQIEGSLALYYSRLLFADRRFRDSGEFIAMECFEQVSAFKTKQTLLLIAARRRSFPKEIISEFYKKLDKLQKTAIVRNKIIHGRWGTVKTLPGKLIWENHILGTPDARIYSNRDFVEIFTRMENESNELETFFAEKMAPHLKAIADAFASNEVHMRRRNDQMLDE
jgi:hypothetical protein